MTELLEHCQLPMHRAAIYRADSRNKWALSDPGSQLHLLLKGLEVLGVDLKADVSKKESDAL